MPEEDTGLEYDDIVEAAVENSKMSNVPQIKIDWKSRIRPALEEIFDDNREYVFHPKTVSIETGFSQEYVEKGFKYYSENMEAEGFKLEYEANEFWKLQRLTFPR